MNRLWAAGAALFLLGKLQEGFGCLFGSSSQQASGFGRQMAGKARMAIGDSEAQARNRARRARDEAQAARKEESLP